MGMMRRVGAMSVVMAVGATALVVAVLPAESALAAPAGSVVVVPNANATTPGGSDNGFPFNCAQFGLASMRYQQVYKGAQVPAGAITGIAFRPSQFSGKSFGPTTVPGVTITLSTTQAAPNGLSNTFGANVGPDVTTVYSGDLVLSSAGNPTVFDERIAFQHPFTFNPAGGNLLLDVTVPKCVATGQVDAVYGSGVVSRAFSLSGSPDGLGLITQFSYTPDQAPLSINSTTGPWSTPLALTTTGGSDSGLVTYTLDAGGTATGCAVTSGGSLTATSPGTCMVTATMAGNSQYNPVSSPATSISFTPVALTATCPTTSRAYGATNPALSPTFTGFVGSDNASNQSITVTCTTTAGATSSPGPYTVTCTGPASSSKYTITCANGTLTITKASQTIMFAGPPSPVTYGVAPITLSASAPGGPVTFTVTGPCTVSGAALTVTGAGSCVITAHQSGNANYSPAVDVTHTLVINPAVLTVTGPSPTIAYGQPIPTLTPTYSGFVNGDSAASLTTKPTCQTTATSTSVPGTYPVTCSGAVDPNYTYIYKPGTLTITKAATTTTLTVTPNPPAVNQATTLTATVHHTGSGAAPTGTVSFYDGATLLGTSPVQANGTATLITTFGGGPHSITAVYSGDTNYVGSTSNPATPVNVFCDQIITGTHAALTVTSGTTCLINATITGGISVGRGASLSVQNSTVQGSISANQPATVRICGSTTGSIAVSAATGYVRIGDPTSNCAPNTINGGLTAANNIGGGTISGNTITGSWTITNNTPPFTVVGNHH